MIDPSGTEFAEMSKADRMRVRLWILCTMLAEHPDGLPRLPLIARVKDQAPILVDEGAGTEKGEKDYVTRMTWWSSGLSGVGWMHKDDGMWFLTDAGRDGLVNFPDPVAFGKEVDRLYKEWKKADNAEREARQQWELVDAVVARIPAGRWVTFTDLGSAVGRYHANVGSHLWLDTPPGWHRVAREGGILSAEVLLEQPRLDEQSHLLSEEGFEPDVPLPASKRLSAAELAGLVAEARGGDRAWLVRGTSVKGANIIGDWLAQGYVSLSADLLPRLDVDADDQSIKVAVDAGYSTLGYSQREARYEEIRAFLRRMRPGDLLLTTSGATVFAGEVTGPATQLESADRRSNLRRAVAWDDTDSPWTTADLASRLQGRLSSSAEIVELTDLIDDVRVLRGPGEGPEGPVEVELPEVVLGNLPEDVAVKLLISRGWLDEFVELLREKKQVILYGPPGTGKTYLAQAVAEALGGQGHVTLVQFHPSYSYEDFFEGYRPSGNADGGVSLQLVPGPFRKVVDLARANPVEPFFLIVDEINRANLAKVFGELYFLLEYRDRTIDLLYSSGDSGPAFSLPDNVYLIGTMNTADRSIALVDAAMRRRFRFLSLHPEDEKLDLVLRAWLSARTLPEGVADLLVELNRRIQDKDVKIGPSYLMSPLVASEAGLERIWRSSILPLLEEYHVGDGIDVKAKYGLDALRSGLNTAEADD